MQAHDEPKPSELSANTQRTVDCVCLQPTDTGHELHNLATQRPIARHAVTELLVAPTVIKVIEETAAKQGQKGLTSCGLSAQT